MYIFVSPLSRGVVCARPGDQGVERGECNVFKSDESVPFSNAVFMDSACPFLKGKLGWSESCCFAESLLTKCKTVLIVCHSWMWTVPDWPWGVHVRNFTGLSSDSCTVEAEA